MLLIFVGTGGIYSIFPVKRTWDRNRLAFLCRSSAQQAYNNFVLAGNSQCTDVCWSLGRDFVRRSYLRVRCRIRLSIPSALPAL